MISVSALLAAAEAIHALLLDFIGK